MKSVIPRAHINRPASVMTRITNFIVTRSAISREEREAVEKI